jgi:hypothetical protein
VSLVTVRIAEEAPPLEVVQARDVPLGVRVDVGRLERLDGGVVCAVRLTNNQIFLFTYSMLLKASQSPLPLTMVSATSESAPSKPGDSVVEARFTVEKTSIPPSTHQHHSPDQSVGNLPSGGGGLVVSDLLCMGYLILCLLSVLMGGGDSNGLFKTAMLTGCLLSLLHLAISMQRYDSPSTLLSHSIYIHLSLRKLLGLTPSVASTSTPGSLDPPPPPSGFLFSLTVLEMDWMALGLESEALAEEAQEENKIAQMPQRFIDAEKGDYDKARDRWVQTLHWREEHNVDRLLALPHETFHAIKGYYPQYFHGRSLRDLPVYYEKPGLIDLTRLKRDGLTLDDLIHHYMYITEYLWTVIEPRESGRSISVVDVAGIGMSDVGGEVLDFVRKASAFTGAHYPGTLSLSLSLSLSLPLNERL